MAIGKENDPAVLLAQGRTILDPAVGPLGYQPGDILAGRGSGGHFAIGRYERADRAIELHVRGGLLMVVYEVGAGRIDHRDWAAFKRLRPAYPGFPDGPLSGFEHLKADLTGAYEPLIAGRDDEAFRECASLLRRDPRVFAQRFLP